MHCSDCTAALGVQDLVAVMGMKRHMLSQRHMLNMTMHVGPALATKSE